MNKRVNAVGQVNIYAGNQIAYIVAGPLFFRNLISLGILNQISSSFGYVQSAMSFIVGAYSQIALWMAIIRRLTEFTRVATETKAIAAATLPPTPSSAPQPDVPVGVTHLSLSLPDGTPLAEDLNLTLAAGDSLLVMGPSGSGKSTLIRAINGIWPFMQGTVKLPADFDARHVLVLPQRPYLPLGTLKEALAYPVGSADLYAIDWVAVLQSAHLEALTSRLDAEEDWSQVLSGGEQQRVALARIFVHKPRYLFLDEGTSALDEATESALYAEIRSALPETAILSIGHRSNLIASHDRQMAFAAGLIP